MLPEVRVTEKPKYAFVGLESPPADAEILSRSWGQYKDAVSPTTMSALLAAEAPVINMPKRACPSPLPKALAIESMPGALAIEPEPSTNLLVVLAEVEVNPEPEIIGSKFGGPK